MGRVDAQASRVGHLAAFTLHGPMLDSTSTPPGRGYYTVASDGGIFAFGAAGFAGSMGGITLHAPMMSLAPDPDGAGYWLVASDGGVSPSMPFVGSLGGVRLNRPISGMVASGAVAEEAGSGSSAWGRSWSADTPSAQPRSVACGRSASLRTQGTTPSDVVRPGPAPPARWAPQGVAPARLRARARYTVDRVTEKSSLSQPDTVCTTVTERLEAMTVPGASATAVGNS